MSSPTVLAAVPGAPDRRPRVDGPAHVDALAPGARLGEFEVVRLLGVGGFGMVYEAFDHSLQRAVAIKEYMPSALVGRSGGQSLTIRSSADQQSFALGLKSFVTEARLLAQFDHPSLVKVFRFWEANNTAYMVMPLYVGTTFKAARAQMRTPPSEAWLRQVLAAVLGALKTLHDANTVHRDVSPDNVFLQDIGPPVLLDLGAARHAVESQTQRHTAILKVNYAPIEQYANSAGMLQGPWTDLYALAAVVHGCLCNAVPEPSTFRLVEDRMPPVAGVARTIADQFGVHYSPAFVETLGRALAIRPHERPQSAGEFMASMQLAPAGDMARFDWRAELKEVWQPPGVVAQHATGDERTQLLTTVAEVPAAPLAAPAAGVTLSLPPPVAPAAPDSVARSVWRFAWAPLVAVFLLGGWAWWRMPAASGVPAPAEAAVPAATSAPDEPVGLGLGSNEVVVAPNPAPAAATAAVQAATAGPPGAPGALAATRRPGATPSNGRGAISATSEPAAPPPAAADPPAPVPPEAPRRTVVEAPAPAALCADANFFTRPMCLHNECQKPAYARSRTCVEHRRRTQDYAQPRPDLAP